MATDARTITKGVQSKYGRLDIAPRLARRAVARNHVDRRWRQACSGIRCLYVAADVQFKGGACEGRSDLGSVQDVAIDVEERLVESDRRSTHWCNRRVVRRTARTFHCANASLTISCASAITYVAISGASEYV
jgi:hypothetical protein